MRPQYLGIDNVYKSKADNKDIRDLLEKLVSEATKQMKDFAPKFRGRTETETCYNIFNFIKNNFVYVADQDEQVIKLPSALLRKKVGDCKSYSLFTASILSNLGIPYHFVYASYNDNPIPHHVYVETENGCKIDVVYGKFNQEKKAKYKYKKNMNVRYMAGLGYTDCDSCNGIMGKKEDRKEKRQERKEDRKEKRQERKEDRKQKKEERKEKRKEKKEKIKERVKGILQKAKTGTPILILARGMFITLVKGNYDGIATKLSLGDNTDLLNRWYKLGGNRTILSDAIKNGSQKNPKKLGFLPKLKKIVGVKVNGIGADKNTDISGAIKAQIISLCVMAGEAIFPEKATGTAVGTAFGGVVVSLLPALKNALSRVPNTESDNIVNQSEKEDPLDDGGDDTENDDSKFSKYLPYILGGVAVLGVGIYFATKKK